MVGPDQGVVEERREGMRVEVPTSAGVRLLSQDKRAIPAVLVFLRDTEVRRIVTLAPREVEEEWEGLGLMVLWPREAGCRAGRGGPGPP